MQAYWHIKHLDENKLTALRWLTSISLVYPHMFEGLRSMFLNPQVHTFLRHLAILLIFFCLNVS